MLTIQAIRDARERIRDSIYLSPFVRSETFSQLTGNSIFFKLENLQMTGSFKERGALNKILLLTEEERRRGVIAASAGNHAQAVAYHATKRGIAARNLHAAHHADRQGLGHARLWRGSDSGRRQLRRSLPGGAAPLPASSDLTFIHPFDDEAVIAGQGTIGLEMLEVTDDLDAVIDSGRRRRLDRRRGLRRQGNSSRRSR